MPTHYTTLGVEPSADAAAIKSAFRQLAQKFHPDKNPGDRAAEQRFKEVAAAYEVLNDADRRAAYDRELRGEASGTTFRRPPRGTPYRPARPREATVVLTIAEVFAGRTFVDDVLGPIMIPPGVLDEVIVFSDEADQNQLDIRVVIGEMPPGVLYVPPRRGRGVLDHILGGFGREVPGRGANLQMKVAVPLPLYLLGGKVEAHIPGLDPSVGTRSFTLGPHVGGVSSPPTVIRIEQGGFPGMVFDGSRGGFTALPPGDFLATVHPAPLEDLAPAERAIYERHLRALAADLKVDVTPPLDWKAALRTQIPLATTP